MLYDVEGTELYVSRIFVRNPERKRLCRTEEVYAGITA